MAPDPRALEQAQLAFSSEEAEQADENAADPFEPGSRARLADPAGKRSTDGPVQQTALADQADDETAAEPTEEPQNQDEYMKMIGADDQLPAPGNGDPELLMDGQAEHRGTLPPVQLGLQGAGLDKINGEPTTVHLDEVDMRKVLEMLSRDHALNILVSPNVKGTVTADLSNLTVEQTLDAVLKSCNLSAQYENGVIYVYTPEEVRARTGTKEDKINVRVYKLNYTRSTDIKKIVEPFLSPEGHLTATPASQVGNPAYQPD